MGYFSWNTMDKGKSIPNVNAEVENFPVVLLVPKEFGGEDLIEKEYEGYGVFGGSDVYELLARWNAPEKCTGELQHDRSLGIDLEYSDEYTDMAYTLKFVSYEYYQETKCSYEDLDGYSENCKNQGYFYPDEDDIDCVW